MFYIIYNNLLYINWIYLLPRCSDVVAQRKLNHIYFKYIFYKMLLQDATEGQLYPF